MRRHRRRLVVVRTTRADRRRSDASQEMPFVLIVPAVSIREACPPAKDDRAEVRDIEADLLREFATGGRFGRLASLDAPAGWVPVRAPDRVRIEQEQEAVLFIEEEHTSD